MAEAVESNLYVNESEQAVSAIAMTVILISFSMLFATLFLGYAAYRFTSETWPPLGIERPDLALPFLSTVLILLSSVTYWRFERQYQESRANASKILLGTIGLGIAFIVSQFSLWAQLKNQGLLLSNGGIFSSIVYAFTWIHAAHMLAGVLLLIWVLLTVKKATMPKILTLRVQNVGKFWHFLGIVWLLMFVTIFVF